MKNLRVWTITVVVIGAVVGILLYNKSRMDARSRNDILASIPVSVTTVALQTAGDERTLVGTVTPNNDVSIVSETQGRVTKVLAEIGDRRAAGSVIVQVDDELKRANFATAEVNYQKAKRDLERFENLLKQDAATDQQVEAARLGCKAAEAQFITARREYGDTKITTPISGTVTARPVNIGTYVQKGMPVANVVDLSTLRVKINVSEKEVFRLKPGDEVRVTTDVYPGFVAKANISTISDKSDESHSYPVEVLLSNSREHPLRSGMFCRVSFVSKAGSAALTIPREALVGSVKNPQVFTVANGRASLRDVLVAAEIGTQLIVSKGLSAGDKVVVSGQNNLVDSAAVTIIN
jgi:RND family efflux transporter MFP subunit